MSTRLRVLGILLFLTPAAAAAQTALALDAGVASGGQTNDVQLTYGASFEMRFRGRLSALGEIFYVRDFFEPDPDDPLSDAATYSGVTGVGGTARLWLFRQPANRALSPYLTIFAGALRAARMDASSSTHAGLGIGGGLRLVDRPRWSILIEARRFSALEQDAADGFHFWRTAAVVGVRFE